MITNVIIISIAPVIKIEYDTKCYNDTGAVEEYHKDNVRLRNCPPPFSKLYSNCDNGVYVYANIDNLIIFDERACDYFKVDIVDNGILVNSYMMEELWNHPWQEQLQKEKSVHDSRVDYLKNRFSFDDECDDELEIR